MEKVYIIGRMTEKDLLSYIVWEKVEKAEVDCYPWDQNGYMPKTEARVVYSEKGFHILMTSYETQIMATRENFNDPVCRDSCMEFFFMPDPGNDKRYLNFELNPLGTLYLGLGRNRLERAKIADVNPEMFNISHSVTKESINDFSGPSWSVRYFIPFSFINRYFGNLDFKSGFKMAGNFYKCAEDTELPHFGSWNIVRNETPDFHRPECFGSLILE